MVRTIWAGSFSWPFRRPAASASRTAFSISRCEVMPTFLRNLRRLALKTSSFIKASSPQQLVRMVQHPLRKVFLLAVGARDGGIARGVAVLAAIDIIG